MNHLSNVCRQQRTSGGSNSAPQNRDLANAIHMEPGDLIAHVEYDDSSDSFTVAVAHWSGVTPSPSEVTEIPAKLKPIIQGREMKPTTLNILPDSGASICLAGSQHMEHLSLNMNELSPCKKSVRAVGGSLLTCKGWILVEFNVDGNVTRQPLFICDRIDRIYFSRQGCSKTNIPPSHTR